MPHGDADTKLLTKLREDIKKQLQHLRDEPVDTEGASNEKLIYFTNFLLDEKPARDGVLHWFCSKADEVVREAAIFLLRLFAYSNDFVTAWKTQLIKSLHGCTECLRSLEEAKGATRLTYFAAFPPEILSKFWGAFENWEVEEIIKAIRSAGISLQSASRTLKHLPAPTLYHLLCTGVAFKNPSILDIIAIHPLPHPLPDIPTHPIPSGCILLLLHESSEIRSWVKKSFNIKEEMQTVGRYIFVARVITEKISNGSSPLKKSDPIFATANAFPFISSQEQLWKELEFVIRVLPPTVVHGSGLSKAVIGHLHDTETHYSEILRRAFQLIQKLGKGLWENEEPDFPNFVFDSIKDNPCFIQLVLGINPSSREKPWFIAAFLDFLASLWDFPSFRDILAKLLAFLCDELQHERFMSVRPVVMSSAAQIISAVVRRISKSKIGSHSEAFTNILDVRARTIITTACSRAYSSPEWELARKHSQSLLHDILTSVLESIVNVIRILENMPKTMTASEIEKIQKPIGNDIWQTVYAEMDSTDSESMCLLIGLCGSSAKLDTLNKSTYYWRFQNYYAKMGEEANANKQEEGEKGKTKERKKPPKELEEALVQVIAGVNRSLDVIRAGFLDAAHRFSNSKTQREVRDYLKAKNMTLHVLALLFSPVDKLNEAARILVGQAFDVEDRADCFRRLFELAPQATFQGIRSYIDQMNSYAMEASDAFSAAKALVRCMSEVIEILGNSPDGLLKNERYIEQAKFNKFSISEEIPLLWKSLTEFISVVFKRTPHWSPYYKLETATEFGRDALIFARDLLDRRRAFEGAVLFASGQDPLISSPRKLSSVGKCMVNDLQPMLENLQSWLRLLDLELLYQSFALLKSLMEIFRDLGVRPNDSALARMRKFVKDSREAKIQITILDTARLAELELYVSSFDDSDDDVVLLTEEVGRKLFAPHKSEPSSSKVNQKAKASGTAIRIERKPSEGQSGDALKRRQSIRDSSSEIEEVIMTKKQQRDLPAHSYSSRPVVFKPREQRYEPKNEARTKPRGPPRPVSPSSSSSDSEEDDRMGLADLAKLQDSPIKPKPKKREARRQIKIIDDPMLTMKNPMQERISHKEAALRNTLRLNPDINPLYRLILSWNYDHEGDTPPSTGNMPVLERVPDHFKDHEEYIKIFKPLLDYECWAQIAKSKEETSPENVPAKVTGRTFVDDWLDIEMEFTEGLRKDWRLNETDVVLLRNSVNRKCTMCKCISFRKSMTSVLVTLKTLTGCDPGLMVGSIWHISIVFNLSTVRREYAALMGLQYYDLSRSIFQARSEDPPYVRDSEVDSAMGKYHVNEPQARAILSSMKTDGFSLIQGPPGTGKTTTICGLVGAFLSTRRSAPTAVVPGKDTSAQRTAAKEKILICAPSNAAIDEVAKRVKEGVYLSSGSRFVPNVVRVGADGTINISVKDISLDALIESKLGLSGGSKDSAGENIAKLRADIHAVKVAKEAKQQELSSMQDNVARMQELDREIRDLNSKRSNLLHSLDRLKDDEKSQSRNLDAARRKARKDVLDESDVICSTLSGAGHDILASYDFNMVIIDEAAQSIEISSLIPLKYRCTRCIMVGDPQQLPPTVLSMDASKWGYNQSLFLRLQKRRPSAVHLLSIQYRMHPDISALPSRIFYDGRLQNGPGMAEKTLQTWHSDAKFGVYRFFNVSKGREESSRIGHSLLNREECRLILALFNRLRIQFPAVNFDYRIGIVSMYRAQVTELRNTFRRQFGDEILSKVDFNTVDGFQGQEKDIIILSCVRAGPSLNHVGFLSDVRRMNVAITRSRSSLFIFGHCATLERSDKNWKSIVEDARARSCLFELTNESYFNTIVSVEPTVASKETKGNVIKSPKAIRRATNVDEKGKAVDQEPSLPAKRKFEGDQPKRPAPINRTDTLNVTSSSLPADLPVSLPPKKVLIGEAKRQTDVASSSRTAILPPKPMSLDDEKKRRQAARDLRALEKRKKKTGNTPFLK